MKKLNQAWVFSDSIIGHELQSLALANEICDSVVMFNCGLRQPWLSFAPRVLPGFGRNIIWKNNQVPDFECLSDVIVTTGRRMAAIGKYFNRKYKLKHIQILNPKDNPKNYDILVCPEHDSLSATNLIQIKGSLHQFSKERLNQLKESWQSRLCINDKFILSLFIGNPGKLFFKELENLKVEINTQYSSYSLYISASRRTPKKIKQYILDNFSFAKLIWLSEEDGDNPYLGLLSCSDAFMVTADSINMISETVATDKPVVILDYDSVSPKHKNYIKSLGSRVNKLGEKPVVNHQPIYYLKDTAQQVLKKLRLKD